MSATVKKKGESEQAVQLNGIRKAAIVLLTLGQELSAEILRELEDEEVERVSTEIAKLGIVPVETAEMVLEEFYQMTTAADYVLKGGVDFARGLLVGAYGQETGKRLLERLQKTLSNEMANFDALQKADPQQLAKFIHSEHPQTIALVLSHLNPIQAGSLLVSLPADLRSDVALRMANLDQISPEIISKIAVVIEQKLKALGEFNRESYGGVRAVSEMLNRLDATSSKEILDKIEEDDPNLVETLRHLMFVFEDMLLIDPNGIREVLARVDRKLLTVALKGTSDDLKNHFLQCMSQRGAQMLREDMDALGAIKIKEVESSQQQIIAVVRQLEAEGVISLKGGGGDQFVV